MSRIQALRKQFEQQSKDKHSSQATSQERIEELKKIQRQSTVGDLVSQHSKLIEDAEKEKQKAMEEQLLLNQLRERRSIQYNKDILTSPSNIMRSSSTTEAFIQSGETFESPVQKEIQMYEQLTQELKQKGAELNNDQTQKNYQKNEDSLSSDKDEYSDTSSQNQNNSLEQAKIEQGTSQKLNTKNLKDQRQEALDIDIKVFSEVQIFENSSNFQQKENRLVFPMNQQSNNEIQENKAESEDLDKMVIQTNQNSADNKTMHNNLTLETEEDE